MSNCNHARCFLLALGVLAFGLAPHISLAQTPAQAQRITYRQTVPDENVLARLVWSTMIALDNANRTNNYAVLYSLGSPQFQRRNTPEQLSDIFSNLSFRSGLCEYWRGMADHGHLCCRNGRGRGEINLGRSKLAQEKSRLKRRLFYFNFKSPIYGLGISIGSAVLSKAIISPVIGSTGSSNAP